MWACQQEDSSNVFVILVILVRVAGVSLSKALNPPPMLLFFGHDSFRKSAVKNIIMCITEIFI